MFVHVRSLLDDIISGNIWSKTVLYYFSENQLLLFRMEQKHIACWQQQKEFPREQNQLHLMVFDGLLQGLPPNKKVTCDLTYAAYDKW